MNNTLSVKDVTTLDLLLARCRGCRKLTILGFWHQLEHTVDLPGRKAYVHFHCESCQQPGRRIFRLTTARRLRRRLIPWIGLAFKLMRYCPVRLRPALVATMLYADRRLRL